jgi:hypothetical protein
MLDLRVMRAMAGMLYPHLPILSCPYPIRVITIPFQCDTSPRCPPSITAITRITRKPRTRYHQKIPGISQNTALVSASDPPPSNSENSAAHLLGVVLDESDQPDIAFTDAAATLTEFTYWLGHPDDILDHWGMPPPPE